MLSTQDLSRVHPGYAEYIYRWDYYMRAYMGAEEWRDGAYLRKYLQEDQAPGNQYQQRLVDTALQNHARMVVDSYRSFIFRNPPTRTLGDFIDNPFVTEFVEDADLEMNNMTAFMREVNDMVLIYGGCWVMVDRPAYQVESAAEEEALGIRAYAKLYNPTNIRNWGYMTLPNGKQKLEFIVAVDEEGGDTDTIRVWYPDRIEKYTVEKKDFVNTTNYLTAGDANSRGEMRSLSYSKILGFEEYENPLGYIPFQHVSTDKTFHKGVGNSHISDTVDIMREIYNLTSEAYQSVMVSSHPTIVAEASADIEGGAGSIITVDENTQVQPYLLQPTAATVESILNLMEQKTAAIEDITHLSAIKAKQNTPASGVSLQVSREMLNVKLSDIASTLERAEKIIWKMWFDWQQLEPTEEFEIYYEKKFDLRDKFNELSLMEKALTLVPHDSFQHYLHDQIAKLLVEDEEDLQIILNNIAEDHREMNIVTPETEQDSQ